MVEIRSAEILMTLSLWGGGGWMGGGGGLKSFLCQTQLLSWVKVELGLWQNCFKFHIVGSIPKCQDWSPELKI